jgi:exodeoxyribonuclease V beta subunit
VQAKEAQTGRVPTAEPLQAEVKPRGRPAAASREDVLEAGLHRYLRGRLPGYQAEEHFGGVLYLFLRGMSGPDTPLVDDSRCGVFSWRPNSTLLTELSDALDGVAP